MLKNLVFTSIKQLDADIITIRKDVRHLGSEERKQNDFLRKQAWFRLIFQFLISLIGIGGGFYLLFSKETSEDTKKFGAGLIGLVLGYWLR